MSDSGGGRRDSARAGASSFIMPLLMPQEKGEEKMGCRGVGALGFLVAGGRVPGAVAVWVYYGVGLIS